MNFKTVIKGEDPKLLWYPRIVIDPETKSIYMLTSEREGTKLVLGNTNSTTNPVGTHRSNWTTHEMVPYTGSLTFDCRGG